MGHESSAAAELALEEPLGKVATVGEGDVSMAAGHAPVNTPLVAAAGAVQLTA